MNKPFDIHGWDYANGRELVNGLIRKQAQRQPKSKEWYEVLLEKYDSYGGKAFGLTLCQEIARFSTRLSVPEFLHHAILNRELMADERVRAIVQDRLREFRSVMIRSSAADEDWIDPRSGVHESKAFSPESAMDEIMARIERNENLVVQRREWGIGCVVDVGFSELLQKPIVRIAHGNIALVPYGGRYSSATWDGESQVGVYDAQTGEPIVPIAKYEKLAAIASDLVRELVNGLKRLEIDFGVQFELVIDPDNTEKWSLVQMRPSPEALRGMRQAPETCGELMCTTGKVSRAGAAEGFICLSNGPYSHGPYACENRIMAWENGALGKWGGELDNLIDAHENGAVAHVAERCWIMNSAHGQFYRHGEFSLEKIEVVQKMLILTPPANFKFYEKLGCPARKQDVRLRLVSDGLVGQIFRL